MTGMQLIRSRRGLSAKLARELKISTGAVAMWREVPAERLIEIERITGIPRVDLRPDLFADMPHTPLADDEPPCPPAAEAVA